MIHEIKPAYLLAYGGLFWVVCVALFPGTYKDVDPMLPGTLLLLTYFASFALGLKSYRIASAAPAERVYSPKAIRNVFRLALVLGFVGDVLRLYQRISSGVSLSFGGMANNREVAMEAGELSGGGLAAAASILYPFGFIAFMICFYFRHHFSKGWFVFSALVGLFVVFDSLVFAGRSTLFFIGFTLLLMVQLRKNMFPQLYWKKVITYWRIRVGSTSIPLLRKKLFTARKIIIVGIGLYASLYFFSAILEKRVFDTWDKLIGYWEDSQQVNYHSNFESYVDHSTNPAFAVGVSQFLHYIAHGYFEFIRLFNHKDHFWGTYYGKYEFYVYLKLFSALGFDVGKNYMEMHYESFHRFSIYTTFWGNVYVDFGIFGIIYAFLLGRFIKLTYVKCIVQKQLWAMLCYPFFGTAVFAMPVLSTLDRQNLYYFPAIAVVSIIVTKFYGKTVIRPIAGNRLKPAFFPSPEAPHVTVRQLLGSERQSHWNQVSVLRNGHHVISNSLS